MEIIHQADLNQANEWIESLLSPFYYLVYGHTQLPTFTEIGERIREIVEHSQSLQDENERLKESYAELEKENLKLREENSKIEAFKRSITEVQRRSQEQLEISNRQIESLQNDVQFWKTTAEQLQQNVTPREGDQQQPEEEGATQKLVGQGFSKPLPPNRKAATSYRGRNTISEGVSGLSKSMDASNQDSDITPTVAKALKGVGGPMADMARATVSGIQVARSKSVSRRVERGEIVPGPLCGLDIDLKKKIQNKLDVEAEAEVRQWVLAMLNENLDEDLLKSLRSGVLLCRIINAIAPGTIKSIRMGTLPFHMMENINSYLQACSNVFGMPTTDVFQTVDLYEGKNLTSVLTNMHSLGRICSKLPGYSGPSIAIRRGSVIG